MLRFPAALRLRELPLMSRSLILLRNHSGCSSSHSGLKRSIQRNVAQTPNGDSVDMFKLSNAAGVEVGILNYGGTIHSLKMPDRHGVPDDIVLGRATAQDHVDDNPFFGCIVGRTAGRIRGGRFDLDDSTRISLSCCDGETVGKNNLHGGPQGLDKRVWQVLNETNVEASEDSGGQISVVMHLHSPHGDQGFPGSINVEVVYTLTDDNYFLMEMAASLADDSSEKRPTPFNLTNHTYFNLAGHAAGASTVEDHMLHMESERVLLADAAGSITGVEAPVEGTPHDFRSGASLGGAIAGIEAMQPRWPHGDAYLTSNQSKVADYESLAVQDAAMLYHPPSGRGIAFATSEPVVQLYFSTFLDGTPGKHNVTYPRHGGVCLEFQRFADCFDLKHPDEARKEYCTKYRPCSTLGPGQLYMHRTAWRLFVTSE